MLVALGIVLGIMWLIARFARTKFSSKPDAVMTVLARQPLGRTSSVAIVKVMDKALVIGITEQGVSLLSETDLDDLETALDVEPAKPLRPLKSPRVLPVRKTAALENTPAVIDADGTFDLSSSPEFAAFFGGSDTPATDGPAHPDTSRKSKLDGSALSAATWKQLLHVAREATVRR